MKNINKALNIIIIILLATFIIGKSIDLLIPAFYNGDSKGKPIKNYENVDLIYVAIRSYTTYYKNKEIEALKKCLYKPSLQENIQYDQDLNIENIKINTVQKSYRNIYIVTYFLNDKDMIENTNENKIILRIDENKKVFKVLYDSLIINSK